MHRRKGLVVLLVLVALGLPYRATAQDLLCFNVPGITNCIQGRFREYWEQNGGLRAFGYPLTPVTNETSDDGQIYPTQWFERNRFELHANNQRPYDVLLGRLGAQRLLQVGRNWQAEPREAGPVSGCLWFAETGHNVCDQQPGTDAPGTGFLSTWSGFDTNGPRCPYATTAACYSVYLAFFGYPLTAPRVETNRSGDTVETQWFERARLEWHNGQVLLGLLGSEIQGDTPGFPSPTPSPAPAAVRILSSSSFTVSGTGHIVGEVQNDTGQNVAFVKVVASVYDSGGTLVGTESTYTDLDILTPGQRSPFEIIILNISAAATSYQLSGQWRVTTDQPLRGLTILSHREQVDRAGYHHIIGEVRNDTGQPVEFVKIVGAFYDGSGKVVATESTYTELDRLEPGQTSPFEMIALYWHNAVRYELQVQARTP